jgi:hypothetical protein
MKIFRYTTQVPSVKTIEYIIEAETEEEAHKKLSSGMDRDEGKEVSDDTYWEEETIIDIEEI